MTKLRTLGQLRHRSVANGISCCQDNHNTILKALVKCCFSLTLFRPYVNNIVGLLSPKTNLLRVPLIIIIIIISLYL